MSHGSPLPSSDREQSELVMQLGSKRRLEFSESMLIASRRHTEMPSPNRPIVPSPSQMPTHLSPRENH